MTRSAFSLLEIIIATAVLAASAMVLSSLIGLGSKYGNRAEERTIAVSQAESLLDEFLASDLSNQIEESSGELPGIPPRGFRINATPFEIGTAISNRAGESMSERSGGLLRVTVEVFETGGLNVSGDAKPLIVLSRLIRSPQKTSNSVSIAMPMGDSRGVAPSAPGAIP